jgi:N-acetylglucosamine-6-phosphate deacetylase
MLGLEGVKGSLKEGADADLVVLDVLERAVGDEKKIAVDQVWKFGVKVHDREEIKSGGCA